MKYYYILSFFLTILSITACQLPLEDRTKKEVKSLSNVDSILVINEGAVLIADQAIYGDLPDSVIAEIKEMDLLLTQADEKIRQAAVEEAALEQEYLEHLKVLDTVSLEDWNDLSPRAFKREQLSFENVQAIYDSNLKHIQQLLSEVV